LVNVVEQRDRYTRRHSDLVAELAAGLAPRCGLSDEAAHALRIAGVLHDIGKIIVPDTILRKPAPLTGEEYNVIKRHPAVGEALIREVPSLPFLEAVVQAVGAHHERYDGLGYPRGLKGEEIPILGRVIAVADAYAAMALDRPYRKALPLDQIIAELEGGAGTQFDAHLVELFVADLKRDEAARAAA
jgi:HD-GYP domain-containing protein (c-di-GMP phosphodiesterase class II)